MLQNLINLMIQQNQKEESQINKQIEQYIKEDQIIKVELIYKENYFKLMKIT